MFDVCPFQTKTGQAWLPCRQAKNFQKSKLSTSLGPQGLGCQSSTVGITDRTRSSMITVVFLFLSSLALSTSRSPRMRIHNTTPSSRHQTSSKPNWSRRLPTFWANSLEIPSQISYRDPKGWVSEASSKSKSQTFSACEYHVKIIYCVPI